MRRGLRALAPLLWSVGILLVVGWVGVVGVLESVYLTSFDEEAFRFERPWAGLLLLGPLLVLASRGWVAKRDLPRLEVSRGHELSMAPRGWRVRLVPAATGMRVAALSLLAICLMGPQSIHARNRTEVEGIDIVLTLDMSLSMQASDIRPNRFQATQQVVKDFVRRRPNDRIGAVVFGRDAYTLLPLTTDKSALQTVIDELRLELIDGRGTAIGNAIGVSLNRLRRSTAESKVIILLTDGDSNAGNISPDQAAELAATMDVRVYTILMGQSEDARVKQGVDLFGQSVFGRGNFPINPELLRSIAERTGGEHFTVSDRQSLERSFHAILDQLEKSEIEDAGKVYADLYPPFLFSGLALLVAELLLATLFLRRWP